MRSTIKRVAARATTSVEGRRCQDAGTRARSAASQSRSRRAEPGAGFGRGAPAGAGSWEPGRVAAGTSVFGSPKNLIAWVKNNAGMGSFYRSRHELIYVFAAPGKPINNFGLGEKGRYRSNVWEYPGFNSFGRGRDKALAMHPTVKPVAMVADALMDCSNRGGIVLDPFGGAGTTMIAAERTKRRARLMEIDPLYCDTIVLRWQDFTGEIARLAETNETFEEVKARRGAGRQ
jgi:DNA methylase